MKARRFSLGLARAIFSLVLISVPWAQGQDREYRILSVDEINVRTVGGVSYLTAVTTFVADAGPCDRVVGQLGSAGTNLSLTLELGTDPHCIIITDPGWPRPGVTTNTSTNVLVLGALPPGMHTVFCSYYAGFWIDGYGWFNPDGPEPASLGSVDFEVPAAPDPMATIRPEGDQVRLDVAGVPLVKYVIEGSVNLEQWTTLYAQIGGPFSYIAPPFTLRNPDATVPQAWFYRVGVYGNTAGGSF
jgi:hypothetical protein